MTRPALLIAVTLAMGCGLLGRSLPEDEHHDEEGEHDEHEAGLGELVVDPDLLRDLRITTETARTGVGSEAATVLGELAVDEERYAEVGVSVAARVRALTKGEGDTVAAGDALAELESAELGRVRAEVASAKAKAAVAASAAERKAALAGGAVSTREIEAARAEADAADAEVRAAEAALASFGAGSSSTGGGVFTIRSPIAGVVLERDARRGEMVDPEHTLFRIADLSHLWLVVHAFERDALRVSEGAAVDVTFAAVPNQSFPGVVARVGREVDAASRTVPIRVELENPDGALRPGMSATASLGLGSEGGGLVVPSGAVQRCDAGWCVFVPRGEGRYEVRPVGRGRDLGSDVEVLSGLTVGESVVVDGAFLLRAEAARQGGGGDEHEH